MAPSFRTPVAALAFLASPAAAAGDGKRAKPMKELMPWYHSTDEIHEQIQDLTATCDSFGTQADLTQIGPDLDVIRLKKKDTTAGTKAVIVFGEHARELISPESALDFVRNLCGTGASAQFAKETLDKGVEFVIVPNANPKGRKTVEDGYYCKRTNENGVDLNRNWGDEHRSKHGESEGDEMNPGPMGFSEPETQALKNLVDSEKPDIFLSVHSGAYLLGSAFGYKHGEPANEAAIDEVLKPISEKHCGGDCPYGGLADMIGYKSEGCDIDYVSEHGTPYAFTWEIYVGEEVREDYISKARARASGGQESTEADSFFFANSLNLAQRKSQRSHLRGGGRSGSDASLEALSRGHWEDEEEPVGCIGQFLPQTKEETDEVVENWSGAYLELAAAVADRKKNPPPVAAKRGSNATTATAPASGGATDASPAVVEASEPAPEDAAMDAAAFGPAAPADVAISSAVSTPVMAAASEPTPPDAAALEVDAAQALAAPAGDAMATAVASAPVGAAVAAPGADPSNAAADMAALFNGQ